MNDNRKHLLSIIRKFLDGKASQEETAFLESYYRFFERNQELTTRLQAEEKRLLEEEMETGIWAIVDGEARHTVKIRRWWPRFAVAASILLIVALGTFFLKQKKPTTPSFAAVPDEEKMPALKGVILTLGNGAEINVAQPDTGSATISDGSNIRQSPNSLGYGQDQQAIVWHTLTNNSAATYEVVLNDGTVVDLDIASSVTYPTAFTGTERKVIVTGQTYFKVTHRPEMPFRVQARQTVIEDIGTEFNIDAYEQVIHTTLVAGAASVSLLNNKVMLTPGKQAISDDTSVRTEEADVDAVTGWLQGNFGFSHEPLESILKKVERIYDVRFSWQDESLQQQKFNGMVSRTKKLSTVLNYIRKTGPVDFVIKGKQINVIRK